MLPVVQFIAVPGKLTNDDPKAGLSAGHRATPAVLVPRPNAEVFGVLRHVLERAADGLVGTALDEGLRETAVRVHGFFAEKCLVYRNLYKAIEISTELLFEPLTSS